MSLFVPTTVRSFTLIYLRGFSNFTINLYGIKITKKGGIYCFGEAKLWRGAGSWELGAGSWELGAAGWEQRA